MVLHGHEPLDDVTRLGQEHRVKWRATTIRDLKTLLDQDIVDSEADQTSSSNSSNSDFSEAITPIIYN